VPLSMLRKRLKVEEYEADTPFENIGFTPERVRLKLSQHASKPAAPVVRQGDRVSTNDVVARVGKDELGVNIHASISGEVTSVTDKYIEIRG